MLYPHTLKIPKHYLVVIFIFTQDFFDYIENFCSNNNFHQRTKTLLAEMKASNNMTLLQDRRIGAGDINMTPEEKELERLKQHHKYKNKKSIFKLVFFYVLCY